MKGIYIIVPLLLFLFSCSNAPLFVKEKYVFIKSYFDVVVVGGFRGLAEMCFNKGDIVEGEEKVVGKITIRIAAHSEINDRPPSPNSYQEFLDIPKEYLRKIE